MRAMGREESHLFTIEAKPPRCIDDLRDNVFAIDFDEKSVRVSRCLNLIAGDGATNILHLNTLDWRKWDETVNRTNRHRSPNRLRFAATACVAVRAFASFGRMLRWQALGRSSPISTDRRKSEALQRYLYPSWLSVPLASSRVMPPR